MKTGSHPVRAPWLRGAPGCWAQSPTVLLWCSALVWLAISCIAFPGLDPYGDMLESFAFTPHYELGTFKHPPLAGWVARGWFSLFPPGALAFHLLSSACTLISMLGVYRLATLYLPRERIALALFALTLTLPYTTLSFKFNANSILMPIWPWIVVYFKRGLLSHRLRDACALGGLAALGMLGKYYTATLLAGLLAAALCTPTGRAWLRSRQPWVAVLVCAVGLSAHGVWLIRADAPTLAYIDRHHVASIDWKHALIFSLSPYLYGAAALAAIVAAIRPGRRLAGFGRLLVPDARSELFWVAFVPVLVTLGFALLRIKPTLHWAVPLLYVFPVYWCARIEAFDPRRAARIVSLAPRFWAVFLVLSCVFLLVQAQGGSEAYYRDDRLAAEVLLRRHAQRFGPERLDWVGGSWPDAAIVPFYTDRRVQALPGLPGHSPSAAMTPPRWSARSGGVLCACGDAACQRDVRVWLVRQGQPETQDRIRVRPQGFWFPRRVETCYRVFWYHPRHRQE